MSWEILSQKNKPCPCKKGTYTIIIESDDWNRLEESWSMNCIECKKLYKLKTKYILDLDGIDSKVLKWVPDDSK